ncbi:MAG: AAA family ATPase [Candidatus Zixiibacteriota bacterium]
MKLIYKSSSSEKEISPEPRNHNRIVPILPGKRHQALLRVDLLDSYKNFFSFQEAPFSVSCNPKFFYFSRSHAEALNHLRYGIYEGLGFTLIIGEPGTGKTLLSRYFLSKAGEDLRITHIADPRISQKELLLILLESLGASGFSQDESTERKLTELLYHQLILTQRQSKKAVIFLDEAQGLSCESLEGLRLLSNLESENQKLIQIVLFGQTELEEKLQYKSLRQLDQRILVRCHLLPLELKEIQPYIQHQLEVANVGSSVEFTPESVNKIYEISQGLPRMVNILCERAMMSAFIENKRQISAENILEGWASLNGIKILERGEV